MFSERNRRAASSLANNDSLMFDDPYNSQPSQIGMVKYLQKLHSNDKNMFDYFLQEASS